MRSDRFALGKIQKSQRSSQHSEARSEYGLEDVDDFERMSQIKAEENNDFEEGGGGGGVGAANNIINTAEDE